MCAMCVSRGHALGKGPDGVVYNTCDRRQDHHPITPLPPTPTHSSPPPLPPANMSSRKRKRFHFQSNTDIPTAQDDVVTRVEFTRNTNRRIHTKTTKVSIPVAEVPSFSPTPEMLPSTYEPTFDDCFKPVPKKVRKTRKGLSRSIAVCTSPFFPAALSLKIMYAEQS